MDYYVNDSSLDSLESIYDALYYGLGIAELGVAGVMMMVAIVTAAVSALLALVIWVLEAIPLYKLAKKTERPMPWLAWIPFFSSWFRQYVVADIPGNKPFDVFGKYKFDDRRTAFWVYLGIRLLGTIIIGLIVSVVSIVIPFIGSFSAILYLIPGAAAAIIEYIFLKDLLDVFKPDTKANTTASIVIVLLDTFVTLGLARTVYLYTLLKLDPLPQGTGDGAEFVVAE